MIQFNDVIAIGDSFEIHSNKPVLGITSITGYTDVIIGETVTRFFIREFRYSLNGITYSSWLTLTDEVLVDTFIGEKNIFDIQYRYTRTGTDTTGLLTFISIQLEGTIVPQPCPKIFTDLYFNKFFNCTDDSVLLWALNVLDKLHKRGIISNFIERNEEGVSDDDYLAFFGAITHFMAIIVRYAREFKNFTLNDILLGEYLKQKGVFVNDSMTLEELQMLLSKLYINFFERGTNEIVKSAGTDGRLIDGEILRMLRKTTTDEFLWGLIEPEKTIWNVNNNSPLYKGTKQAINLIKAYEYTQDVTLLSSFPLIEDSFVTKYTDTKGEVLRILNVTTTTGTILSGIGGAELQDKIVLVNPRISYEITFQVKQAVIGDYLSLKVSCYDKEKNLLLNSPISAIDGTPTNISINKKSLLKDDVYYFVRLILFNQNIPYNSNNYLDVGLGNHLILDDELIKYISVELGSEIISGEMWNNNNDLRIYDFKVRPLTTQMSNSFVMIPNVITTFLENNSESTNKVVENNIKRFFIPYNTILVNQFLDEIVLPTGTPLKIYISHTDETINGADNGTITISAVGGVPVYLYSIDNGSNLVLTNRFTNLMPGIYNILVLDSIGTEVTGTITILAGATALDFDTSIIKASTLISSDAEMRILPFGGSSPYFHSIDSGIIYFVSNNFTGLAVGNYDTYVRDTSGNIVHRRVFVDAIRNKILRINIKDELSNDLESVNVSMVTPTESYLTDAEGNVTIYLEVGLYKFNFSKAGFKPFSFGPTSIYGDKLKELIMQTYYFINFHVKDGSGSDISFAKISTTLTPPEQNPFTVTTNILGEGLKEDIIAGNYRFITAATGFVSKVTNYLFSGFPTLDIILDVAIWTLSIHVNRTDAYDVSSPAESVDCRIYLISSKLTNSAGDVTFNLEHGSYNLTVEKFGLTPTSTTISLNSNKLLLFNLRETYEVEVRLHNSSPGFSNYSFYSVEFLGYSNFTENSDIVGKVIPDFRVIAGIYTLIVKRATEDDQVFENVLITSSSPSIRKIIYLTIV